MDCTSEYIILDILNESSVTNLSQDCCIYKIPEDLREQNKGAFAPHLISIGPIHHNNPKLKSMEQQKYLYFRYFRDKLSSDEDRQNLESYTAELEEGEEQLRKCYSEKYTHFEKNRFVRMMLLDAVFIMELFLRKKEGQLDHDVPFKNSTIRKIVERDLILLENQIPFYLLNTLFDHVVPTSRKNELACPTFLELARSYFEIYDPYDDKSVDEINTSNLLKQHWDRPKHFTDLIRYFMIPQHLVQHSLPDEDGRHPIIKTATKLKGVGIAFEKVSNKCLLDVQFKKGGHWNWLSHFGFLPKKFKARLLIPKLTVDYSTESVLRNLMAFEQYSYPNHHYVSSYVALITDLIHSKEDVDVMVEDKVIAHELGSDKELAQLINILGKNTVLNSPFYDQVSRGLNKHCDRKINKTLGLLSSVYFPDLWGGTATAAAIIVLLFAITNFVKNIINNNNNNNKPLSH
ncbi:putative UPF0481 protein At3g02645 [Prosopis cineraria]|uniref:putative UPF0481 protein At3g02645 n=1 Tax=Prosopis cineraria TaxID=364024 RepID=UPI00240FE3A9|nr:putative UPF0481 protein At3g02645 [Prosopis cineraria]